MAKQYINISLPSELIRTIDEFILQNRFGYKSRAELTKEAIRMHLRELDSKRSEGREAQRDKPIPQRKW